MNTRKIFINRLFINIKALIIYSFYESFNLKKQLIDKRDVKDVLFINGCNPNLLPHPYRYRVLHQIEQLKVGFLESDEIFYLDFNPIIVRYYRVLIFFVVHGQIMLKKQ